jgi:hypothetical protein
LALRRNLDGCKRERLQRIICVGNRAYTVARVYLSGAYLSGWKRICHPEPLIINVKVYIIADKYGISALNELAKSKYNAVVADKLDCSSFAASLRMMCNEIIEVDRLLKDVVIKAASAHIAGLLKDIICSRIL